MFVAARQHAHLTRFHLLNELTVSACFAIAFILMISGLGLWLIGLVEPQHNALVPTLLELGSFSFLCLGAHLADLIDRRELVEKFGGRQTAHTSGHRDKK